MRREKQGCGKLMTVTPGEGARVPLRVPLFDGGRVPRQKDRDRGDHGRKERRLAFVAVTRAQKMLYVSDSGGRIWTVRSVIRRALWTSTVICSHG